MPRRHRHPRHPDPVGGGARQSNMVNGRGGVPAAGQWGTRFYFSACRSLGEGPHYHHVGIYAFRREALPASSPCRRACSSGASGWSSCARSSRHAHRRPPSLTHGPSVSILRPTSRAPGILTPNMTDPRTPIAFQGEPGAYSDLACRTACRIWRPALRHLRGHLRRRRRGPRGKAMIAIDKTRRRPRRPTSIT